MAKRKKSEEAKGGSPEWMTTFSDLMTLLLCFFVLLFAFSTIDQRKFTAVMKSFQGSAGVLHAGKTIDGSEYINKGLNEDKLTKQLREIENFRVMEEKINNYLIENEMENEIFVELESRGLLIRLNENVLFGSGEAELKENSKETLRFLGDIIKQEEFKSKYITVEGHTDSDPIIRSKKYPTNWELSIARASNVVRFLIEDTYVEPKRLSASGYSQYHPVAPNDTMENKAKNRRVDILILRSDFSQS
ncbi:flagellar motor protein MotB [Anaeromicrobium sediminis]|uniref:Flagellar motor protein MotB n=1 Tax=Anaeromicrobium sediminis TaxID=1478221 RepID=A0A267MR67_9FIRM|nr:flagellar motor protein MotB [Anaeromicrobium sediminis]PAB61263.1 flagellar motor protein MotB [Anaeromicrobium sediminis]